MKTLNIIFHLLVVAYCHSEKIESAGDRESKLLPIFQVVRFPNDICSTTTRNGTCYTSEECSSKGGTTGGSCAQGFGVCCVFETSCGSTSSENVTYLVQSASTSISSPCLYKVCPCNSNICRIRYDFTTLVIASASTVTLNANGNNMDQVVGACVTDSLSIASPGAIGSPVICGTNTGYHMVLDASEECQTVNFQISPSTSTTRQWDIKVTQYACGDDDKGGPPGCLQYYTGAFGVLASFNFPPSQTTVATSTTHLQSQHYSICMRRESGYCHICYSPSITAAAPNSFGLSVSANNAISQTQVGTDCATDFITIPNAAATAIVTTTTIQGVSRICGRIFASAQAAAASATVCSHQHPFTVGVSFDQDEATSIIAADADGNEFSTAPAGLLGFKLDFFQISC